MKYRYIATLLLLGALSSCSESDDNLNESDITKEPVDYSSFFASIDNTLSDKVVSRAVSYGDYAKPELMVSFEGGEQANYTYNTTSLCYEVDDATQLGEKALYVHSTEYGDSNNGAMVAAAWPDTFAENPATIISLKNIKPRIRINYKYADTEAIATVSGVSLCNIYTQGEFAALPTIIYTSTGDLGEVQAAVSTDEYSNILTDDELESQEEGVVTYTTGAFELYTVPQVLSTYDAYVKFTIDGEDHLYYFKDKVSFESHYCYEMVFEIKMFEGAVDIELTEQSEYGDWEDEGDGLIVTIDPANAFDTWDGSSVSTMLEGSGNSENPYLIYSAADLKYFTTAAAGTSASTYLSAHYRLEQNIDWNSNAWTMVGSNSAPFLGTFDGDGHTIKNLALSYGYSNGGMFGFIGQAATTTVTEYIGEIKNLSITGVFTGTGNNIAGFVGQVQSSSNIENCHFSGSVTGALGVGAIAGSLSGRVAGCSVVNSTIIGTGESTSTTKGTGAVVGQIWANTNVKFEYNVALNSTVSNVDEKYTGALVGSTWNQWQPLWNSFSSNVTSDNAEYIFGLVGYTGNAGEDPTTDTYTYLYQSSYYTGSAAYLDPAYYLDPASYSAQEMCNMLIYGDITTQYDPDQNAEGWYWSVNDAYDAPFPTYNSK